MPTPVPSLERVQQIAAGNEHTCALLDGGVVACWGSNRFGALGPGFEVIQSVPVQLAHVSGASRLAAGDNHTCAVMQTGGVTCWGLNDAGQAGDTTLGRIVDLASVPDVPGGGELDSDSNHSCALDPAGALVCWGGGSSGQLGGGDTPTFGFGRPAGLWLRRLRPTARILVPELAPSAGDRCHGRGAASLWDRDRSTDLRRLASQYSQPVQHFARDHVDGLGMLQQRTMPVGALVQHSVRLPLWHLPTCDCRGRRLRFRQPPTLCDGGSVCAAKRDLWSVHGDFA